MLNKNILDTIERLLMECNMTKDWAVATDLEVEVGKFLDCLCEKIQLLNYGQVKWDTKTWNSFLL